MFTSPSRGTVRRANSKKQFYKFNDAICERYLFFVRGQESGESIDKYATVLRNFIMNSEI